jgi:hypothetical protein
LDQNPFSKEVEGYSLIIGKIKERLEEYKFKGKKIEDNQRDMLIVKDLSRMKPAKKGELMIDGDATGHNQELNRESRDKQKEVSKWSGMVEKDDKSSHASDILKSSKES